MGKERKDPPVWRIVWKALLDHIVIALYVLVLMVLGAGLAYTAMLLWNLHKA